MAVVVEREIRLRRPYYPPAVEGFGRNLLIHDAPALIVVAEKLKAVVKLLLGRLAEMKQSGAHERTVSRKEFFAHLLTKGNRKHFSKEASAARRKIEIFEEFFEGLMEAGDQKKRQCVALILREPERFGKGADV